MPTVTPGRKNLLHQEDGVLYTDAVLTPADANDALAVILADTSSEDGRSPWYWLRLPNGDLLLVTYPQGGTYLNASDAEAAARKDD